MVQMTVSPSEFDSYVSCERKHYYAYGLGIQRKGSSDSLNRGTLGHHFVEHYFNLRLNGTNVEDAMTATRQYMVRYSILNPEETIIAEEAKAAIEAFFKQGGFNNFEILAVEKEFQVELSPGEAGPAILFKVDLIVRDADGKIGVIDNKFVSNFYTPKSLSLMSQLPKYAGALRIMGYDIDWVAYAEFKASSRQAFRFTPFPISDERVRRTLEEHETVAYRIINRKRGVELNGEDALVSWSDGAIRVQNSMTCKNCSFFELCVAELNNQDAQLVLDRLYKKKEYNNGLGFEQVNGTDSGNESNDG